jgi:Uma2 family endonuclease
MVSLPNSRTVTNEEWLRMAKGTDTIEEVLNGEIRITPPAKLKHAIIPERIHTALKQLLDTDRVIVLTGSFDLIVGKEPLTWRIPDLAVFELATLVEQDGYIHSAPQLLVEVLSPANTRQEREEKLADYASIGVPEVWAISPEARIVEILALQDGFLRSSQILGSGTQAVECE